MISTSAATLRRRRKERDKEFQAKLVQSSISTASSSSLMGTSKDQSQNEAQYQYCLISNIPADFRSSDLRNFFSEFIEARGFDCFNYRHRPQVINIKGKEEDVKVQPQEQVHSKKDRFCGLARFSTLPNLELFIRKYHSKFWIKEGIDLPSRCLLTRVNLAPIDLARFDKELKPPRLFPNGNVGTPNSYFLDLIRTCQLPPRLIKKLDLEFPRLRCFKKYSKVPFDYGTEVEGASDQEEEEEEVRTAKGHTLSSVYVEPQPSSSKDDPDAEKELGEVSDMSDADDDDDRCEEWERHESLHNDVTAQERTKERLYEEEVELMWEKGGPGLVWWTDAVYWDAKEGDFDEQTADDLDVDMEGYYVKGGGDKDARHLADIRRAERIQKGLEHVSMFSRFRPKSQPEQGDGRIGAFEQWSKGIGRKIMEKAGWKEGDGIGGSRKGLVNALEGEGQSPRDRRGIGYYGEKLEIHKVEKGSVPKRKKRRVDEFGRDQDGQIVIGTIFDPPEELDQEESDLRSTAPSYIKRRQLGSKLVLPRPSESK